MRAERAIVALAALAAFAGAGQVFAQPRPDRNCTDDRGVDRCDAGQQRRMRELFGVPAIEAHRDAGDQVRRVFYVDGYGRDMVVITFIRARGRDPAVRVHFPQRAGQSTPPIEIAVSQDVWEEALRRSTLFDRAFSPQPQPLPEDNVIVMCLHSWVYTIEATDPARGNGDRASLRRSTEDACQDGPGEMFADEVSRTALGLFPHCSRLDPAQHRNAASQLAACAMLAGDRLAAAEVLNRLRSFERVDGVADRHRLDGLFDYRATIDWNGARRSAGGPDATSFWVERVSGTDGGRFWPQRVEGIDADRVRVTGFLERSVDGPEGSPTTYYHAPVEMIWSRTLVRQFQVTAVTVRPFVVYRPR